MSAAVIYRITLLEPTLVVERDGDPNSAVSFPFLPGSTLRGALISRYGLSNSPTQEEETKFRRLFLSGAIRFLNGYPIVNDRRSLPVPLSWHFKKQDKDTIRDLALRPLEDEEKDDWQRADRPFQAPFEEDKVSLEAPLRHVVAHNLRSRQHGYARPGDEDGALFRYDALAPYQTFEAVVVCDRETDADQLKSLLDSPQANQVRLGGSTTAGYGRARFESVRKEKNWSETGVLLMDEETDSGDAGWEEKEWLNTEETISDNRLVITFLSDALLRDEFGQYAVSTEVVRRAVARRLGMSEEQTTPKVLSVKDAFLRERVVGGFNRKWGLPLPQGLAVRMGSIVVFEKCDCSEEAFLKLQTQGIGERLAEGFGRVAVNWQWRELLPVRKANETTFTSTRLPDDLAPQATEIAKRILRRRVQEQILASANRLRIDNPPKNSQISRLRARIRQERMKDSPSLKEILSYLGNVEERKFASDQFQAARIGNQSLIQWLKTTLDIEKNSPTPERWEGLFGVQQEIIPAVGGVKPDLDALWGESLLGFVDATLARAAKEKRQQKGKSNE
jgi:CRISPR-associated protein Csx10